MTAQVLILSQLGDVHAYAVTEALRRKQADVTLWYTSDFPAQSTEAILFERSCPEIKILSPALCLEDPCPDAVWRRRPSHTLDLERLHPADRAFADTECMVFRRSLFDVLAPSSFWVNPPEASIRANRKLLQHKLAVEIGFKVPETLYGNAPIEIRAFMRRHGGKIVYKPLHGASWRSENFTWMPFTNVVTEKTLVADHLLQATPGIFQELLEKDYEIRVTMIGNRPFAAKILSQETASGRLDWRKSYSDLRMEPMSLPDDVAERCREMLRKLGLVFGCFDFIVTPAGEWFFLEINEMGQFLFVEHYTGQPLLDAFSELLIQRDASFEWPVSKIPITYADVEDVVRAMEADSPAVHVAPVSTSYWEGSTQE